MSSEQWAMGYEQWAMSSGYEQWAMGSEQWAMSSGYEQCANLGSSRNLVGKNAISLLIGSRFFKAWANKSIKNRRSEDRNPPTTSAEYTSVSIRLFLGRLLLSRAYLRFTGYRYYAPMTMLGSIYFC